MDWRIKGVLQKTLSALPWGEGANDRLQDFVGGHNRLRNEVEMKLRDDFPVLADLVRRTEIPLNEARMLEIGTGWYPTMPVGFSLLGAKSCETFDLTAHLNAARSLEMLRIAGEHLPQIADAGSQSLEPVRERFARLSQSKSLDELLSAAQVRYHAPADATRTGLPEESMDIVYSNTVLEHVASEVLPAMFREMARILRPGGAAVHSVNCGDHYAFFDRTITQVNYLRYSTRAWALWNNDLQFQNRLRPRDFLRLAEESGLELKYVAKPDKPKHREALAQMDVAPEFAHYPLSELAATCVDFVAIKR